MTLKLHGRHLCFHVKWCPHPAEFMCPWSISGTRGLGVGVVCDVTVKARACSNFGVGDYPRVVRGSVDSYTRQAPFCDVTGIARASSNLACTVEAKNNVRDHYEDHNGGTM